MAFGDAPTTTPAYMPGQLPSFLPVPLRRATTPTATTQQNLAQALMAGGSAQTAIASQQAQQLAAMLESTQQQGLQHSSTLPALAANLGADFLNHRSLSAAQKALVQDVLADRAATNTAVTNSVTNPTPAPPPQLAPAAPQSQPAPAASPAASAAPSASTTPGGDVENDVRAAYSSLAGAPTGSTPSNSAPPDMITSNAGTDQNFDLDMRNPSPDARLPGIGDGFGAASSTSPNLGGSTPSGNDALVQALLSGGQGGAPASSNPFSSSYAQQLAAYLDPSTATQPSAQGSMQMAGADGPAAQPNAAPPNFGAVASAGAPQGFNGPANAVSPGRVGPPVTASDKDALVRMVYGEARGEPLQGQQATAAVALNRSILSGQSLSQIVNAPGQFEGMKTGATLDTNSPEYQRVAAAIEPLLSGQMADPSGGATGFYAPAAQAALGRSKPTWDDGSGRQIGNQLFFNHPFAGQTMPSGRQGGVQPYQIASNGPTPGPPSYAVNGGQGAPQPQQTQPAPQQPLQVPRGPAATPQELATINAYLNAPSPELRQQAYDMAAKIRDRMLNPIDEDQRYDASTGQTTYVPKVPGYGVQQVQGPPQGWRAPLATGQVYGPGGQVQATPGTQLRPLSPQERAAWGIPANDGASYGVGPDGKPVKVADGTFGPTSSLPGGGVAQYGPNGEFHSSTVAGSWSPAQIIEARNQPAVQKPVADAREAMANYGALQQLATQPGGTKAYAFRDALARIFNPGGIARTNQIELLTNSAGVPDAVKQYFQSLQGDGNLDPRIAQQGLDAAYAFAKSRADQVAGMNASNQAFARRHGVDPADLTVDLDPLGPPTSLPGQRSAYAPAPQAGGGGQGAAAAIAAARAAIQRGANRQAVMQRLQASGVNPGAL